MEKQQLVFFFFLIAIVCLFIIIGLIVFLIQYRKRKIEHAHETQQINMNHQHELQEATLEMQQLTMQDIGREIHDGVGQRLTLASIYTKQLLSKEIDPDTKVKAQEINAIINESLGQLRSLSKELTNEKNFQVDINQLIEHELNKMIALQVCEIHMVPASSIFVDHKTAMFVIRIMQEFLQNSLKHAECTHIYVELKHHESQLIIHVSDDGKGFDVNVDSKGIGLHNMKRRAELIHADLVIESVVGKGTSLMLTVSTI